MLQTAGSMVHVSLITGSPQILSLVIGSGSALPTSAVSTQRRAGHTENCQHCLASTRKDVLAVLALRKAGERTKEKRRLSVCSQFWLCADSKHLCVRLHSQCLVGGFHDRILVPCLIAPNCGHWSSMQRSTHCSIEFATNERCRDRKLFHRYC